MQINKWSGIEIDTFSKRELSIMTDIGFDPKRYNQSLLWCALSRKHWAEGISIKF